MKAFSVRAPVLLDFFLLSLFLFFFSSCLRVDGSEASAI